VAVDYYLVSAAKRLHRLKTERSYVFGRDEKADIHIQDAMISRRHAELRWSKSGAWEVVDLGSRNGVLVNGRKISGTVPAKDGTKIQVGGQIYRLHLFPPGADPSVLTAAASQLANEETMGPDFKMDDIVTKGANFVGEVGTDGVLDLLQYFQVTNKSGRLDLTGGPNLAAVWFENGAPIHAFMGAKQGLESLIAMARTPPRKFAFHAGAPPPPSRSLTGSLQALLMEVARVLDEDKR
jgi:hypothetical protein